MSKTGITNLLRKLKVNESLETSLRTSEIYLIAKRIGIKVKKNKVNHYIDKITRIL